MKKAEKIKSITRVTDFFTVSTKNQNLQLPEVESSGIIDQNNIKISSWNINGIRAVTQRGDLQKYISSLQPDIYCLNELKISQDKFDSEKLQQFFDKTVYPFQFFNLCKPPIEGYCGVAIISKFAPKKVIYKFDDIKHNQEGRFICLEFDAFYLISTYVPNAGQKLDRLEYRTQEWDIDLRNVPFILKFNFIIFSGDLNCAHQPIDLTNPQQNLRSAGFTKEERQGNYSKIEFSNLLDSGFKDIFRIRNPDLKKYSFWSYRGGARAKNMGWRLDYFLLSDNINLEAVRDVQINNDILGSDHCPVEIDLDSKYF